MKHDKLLQFFLHVILFGRIKQINKIKKNVCKIQKRTVEKKNK